MNPQQQHSRGMAVVMVIVLIGVLAVVMASVAGQVVAQQRRAASSNEAIQISRLLAAAARIAEQQAATSSTHDGPIETPAGTVTLAWRGTEAARACEVNVDFGHTKRTIMLAFSGSRVVRAD